MTADEFEREFTYDAWNRLRDFAEESAYAYDALGRRIRSTAGDGWEFYHSSRWQVIEEWVSGNKVAQYVWSPVYVDAMVLRDYDTGSDEIFDQRLYAAHDANFNVTALIDDGGDVVERFRYDPYGAFTVLDPNWSVDDNGLSDVNWVYLHQGGRYDGISGLYHFRHRDYSPTLGRWVQQDYIGGYVDGMNLYLYVGDRPVSMVDPLGDAQRPGWVPGLGMPVDKYPPPKGAKVTCYPQGCFWTPPSPGPGSNYQDGTGSVGSAVVDGLQAWADGLIPFVDPFADNDYYNPNRSDLQGSKMCGQVSFWAWSAALAWWLKGKMVPVDDSVTVSDLPGPSDWPPPGPPPAYPPPVGGDMPPGSYPPPDKGPPSMN